MSAILTTIQDNSMQWLALGADAAIKGLVLLARTATARWFSLRFALATAIIVSTVMPLAYAGPTANGDKSVASADNADISKEDPANSFQQKAELATPPEKAIVIDPHMPWVSRGDWAHELKTDITVMDTKKGYSRFIVGAAGKRHIWNKTLDAPIDRKRYSTLVMTYRARNAGDLHDVVWLNDGSGDDGNGFAAIDCKELISDGQVHVIRKDLAKRSSQNQIKGIAMVLHWAKRHRPSLN